jgi:hypothetical protein
MSSLRRITCLLCGGSAEIGPSILPDGGPRANREAVLCGSGSGPCGGYIIESSLREPGAIPAEVRGRLSQLAVAKFRETGSGSFEINEPLVRSMRR